jgi:bifunctional DNase/RNase
MTAMTGLLTVLVALLLSCTAPQPPDRRLYAVHVDRLVLDDRTDSPVLLLKETHGARRELPIWIGMTEAQSIAMAMEEMVLPRPNTHDLIKNLLDGLHGDIRRVVITELRGHTYYAVIEIGLNGREVAVDSRPSDAIAVAIRTGAPLFATDSVLVPPVDEDQGPALDIDFRNVFAPRQSETLSPV